MKIKRRKWNVGKTKNKEGREEKGNWKTGRQKRRNYDKCKTKGKIKERMERNKQGNDKRENK